MSTHSSPRGIVMPSTALNGHLPAAHPLSPRQALQDLPALVRQVIGYAPASVWDIETARLPARLQAHRRRARDFARQQLTPLALAIDSAPHPSVGTLDPRVQQLLQVAGQEGWLTDLLPWPLGSCAWLDAPYPMVWRTCLKIEEFARACGGLMHK